jgi:hypothetical protein
MGWADADIVDDDWLVCEDIFVFGGHSTLGEGEGMEWNGLCRSLAHGTVSHSTRLLVAPCS